jgi:REP element-mobilizing transposase RayT
LRKLTFQPGATLNVRKLSRGMIDHNSSERPPRRPRAYLITFACYGARLHGHPVGSVDRDTNGPQTPLLHPDAGRMHRERERMRDCACHLDRTDRSIVLTAVRQHCDHREWVLHAAHVRSNHVHVVVSAPLAPELILGQLKAYAARALNESQGRRQRRWSYHGSTRYLWEPKHVAAAVDYVVWQQGFPVAFYVRPEQGN